MQAFLQLYPQAKWHVYEPVNRDNVLEGAKLAFGQPVETQYDFSKADVILSLDADFLYAGFPGFTRYARDFAKRRNPDAGEMSRLYVVESMPSSTGAKADHRLPVCGRWKIERFARLLLSPGSAGASGSSTGGAKSSYDLPPSLWQGSAEPSRLQPGDRGGSPVAGGPCHGSCHQPESRQCRQDGDLHRTSRCQSDQPDRLAERPGRRHARRQGGLPGHSGRKSCLRCSGGFGFCRCAQEYEYSAAAAFRPGAERNRGTLPLARQPGALPRSLG